ncbi:anibiotic ABC transporter [Erwinia psidii]|uniref:TolC family outer membrane protein n=1 Tax=Erwinia psidii TaxID=69224 RepID=UPI00226B74AE|nr:TolC family outer membrane protein [Erwinia psidii]MCX8958750.1 anibiotic ABC transporter [Erwinia psidii]
MKIKIIGLFSLITCFYPASTHAANLQQSVLAASGWDSEYKAAIELRDAEGQKPYQGFAGLLPEISLSGTYYKQDQPSASYAAGIKRHNYSINLQQPLFDLSRYATWQRAKAAANAADATFMLAQQKLIQNVAKAYFGVLFARKKLETSQRESKSYKYQLEKATQALAIGDGTLLDVDEARASFDRSTAEMLSAENDLSQAGIDFNRLTGLSADGITEGALQCLFHPLEEKMDVAVKRAIQKNFNVIAALYHLEEAKADVTATTAAHLPVVSLQAMYGNNWSRAEDGNYLDEIFGTTSKTKNTYIGVNVSVPIFAGGKMLSQNFEAASRRNQNVLLVEDARRKVAQEVKVSWLGVKNNFEKIQAYKRLQSSSRKKLDSTIYGKEVGLRTLIDQFEAEKDMYRAIQDLTETENNFLQQKIALDAATGDLDYSTLNSYVCP